MSFSFQRAAREPGRPEGEHTFVFKRLGGDERREIPADGFSEAWEGLRFHEGAEWRAWRLLGFSDLVADGVYDTQVATTFAAVNPTTVEVWAENDSD